jgi:hypothetical protein
MFDSTEIWIDFLVYSIAENCRQGEHSCGGQCIDPRRLCDGYPDCADHSDEANCSSPEPEV